MTCPTCQAVFFAAMGKSSKGPRDGDLGICTSCGTVFRVSPGHALIALTPAEIAALDVSTQRALAREQRRIRREVQ